MSPQRLRAAWERVVAWHLLLRAQFRFDGPRLLLYEIERPRLPIREGGAAAGWETLIEGEFNRPFAHGSGWPLWRILMARGSAGELIWTLTLHRAIVDWRSLQVVVADFLHACLDPGAGRPVSPDFGDFLAWSDGQDWPRKMSAWRAQTQGPAAAGGARCFDALAAPHGEAAQERIELDLAPELVARLAGFADDLKLPLAALLCGAWAIWLSRTEGEPRACFGAMGAGGGAFPGAERVVGPLRASLPLCLAVPPDMRLAEWLGGVGQAWRALREIEHCPSDLCHVGPGGPGTAPMRTAIQCFNAGLSEAEAAWNAIVPCAVHGFREGAELPLVLAVYERPRLKLELAADLAQIGRGYLRRAARALPVLLADMAAHPDAPLGRLALLDRRERAAVLAQAYGPRPGAGLGLTVWDLLERSLRAHADRPALVAPARTWTYRALGREARAVAGNLACHGVGRGAVVGTLLPAGPELAIAMAGILMCGGAFLVLNPAHPGEGLRRVLAAAPLAALLVEPGAALGFEPGCPALSAAALGEALAAGPPFEAASPGDLAYLVPTSGSTGEAKLVQIEHHSAVNFVMAMTRAYGLQPTDRRLQRAQPGTDHFVAEIVINLCAGTALVFPEAKAFLGIAEFSRYLEREEISVVSMASSYWHDWVRSLQRQARPALPACLRAVITGMESVDLDMLRWWQANLGGRVRWFNVYGPSECTLVSSYFECRGTLPAMAVHAPIGKPIAGAAIYVLDRGLEPLPPGMPGELFIAGRGVMRGYATPGAGTAKLLPNPHSDDPAYALLYRIGDFGYRLPGGDLAFIGREDNQIKLRGHRIELEALEAELVRVAGASNAAVVAVGHLRQARLWGVVETAQAIDEDGLRAALGAALPHALVPSRIIAHPRLPRRPSGKIDRQAIAAEIAAQAADNRLAQNKKIT
jgi:amino acid adenylation domain-containing protein